MDSWTSRDAKVSKNTNIKFYIPGVPVIMSTPHFLDADPSLPLAIEGVEPIREKHITFLDIEPNTGGMVEDCFTPSRPSNTGPQEDPSECPN